MVGMFFMMIVGHISTYVVKSYLTSSSLVLFPPLSMETSVPLSPPSILDFHCFEKQRRFYPDFPNARGHKLLQGRRVPPPGVKQWHGVWNFKTQAGLFVHLDCTAFLQVHRWRGLHGHPHDKNPILLDFSVISSFFMGEQKRFLISVAAVNNGNLETKLWPRALILIPANTFEESDHFFIVHRKFLMWVHYCWDVGCLPFLCQS